MAASPPNAAAAPAARPAGKAVDKFRAAGNAAAAVAAVSGNHKRLQRSTSVKFNFADPDDPSKPKAGTLKGVQAAEAVYRRRLAHQYVLNPSVWYLKILIAHRNEDVAAAVITKKMLFQEEAAAMYAHFVVVEEEFERHFLTFAEFSQGSERLGIESEQKYVWRWLTYGFEDRLQLITSERDLREHITTRALEKLAELHDAGNGTRERQEIEEAVDALFRSEHDAFLARLLTSQEEFVARAAIEREGAAELEALVEDALRLHRCRVAEAAARAELEAGFDAFFVEILEPEYERARFMVEGELPGRRRIEGDSDAFMREANDAIQRLLDVFYEERAEEERQRLEAERKRREAAEAAFAALMLEHRKQRKALEDEEAVGRSNRDPPEQRRERVSPEEQQGTDDDDQEKEEKGDEEDDMRIEWRIVEVGPPLGVERQQELEWATLLEAFDSGRWGIEEQLASAAEQRQRIVDVATSRMARIAGDEADARERLYRQIDKMKLGLSQLFADLAELEDEEEQQRATFDWAEVESRAAIAKLMASGPGRRGRAPKIDLPDAPKARPQQQPTSPTPPPPPPPGAHVVYVQGGYPGSPPPGSTIPYPHFPSYAANLPPRTIGGLVPQVAPLPYEGKIFKRSAPDGGEVTVDLAEAEDEIEAMVNAATMPLGILEYELRSKWLRTKQQLINAIQQKMLEPLQQMAAELPDGEDIVRRAREAVPPPALSPASLTASPKPRKAPLTFRTPAAAAGTESGGGSPTWSPTASSSPPARSSQGASPLRSDASFASPPPPQQQQQQRPRKGALPPLREPDAAIADVGASPPKSNTPPPPATRDESQRNDAGTKSAPLVRGRRAQQLQPLDRSNDEAIEALKTAAQRAADADREQQLREQVLRTMRGAHVGAPRPSKLPKIIRKDGQAPPPAANFGSDSRRWRR